jgi:hypothetical protein
MFEGIEQRAVRQRRGGIGTGAEAQRERSARRQLASQHELARAGFVVVQGHPSVALEIRAQIARLHMADAEPAPGLVTFRIGGEQSHTEGPLPGQQRATPAAHADRGEVVFGILADARQQACIRPQRRVAFEMHIEQNHVAIRVRTDAQRELEARMAMVDRQRRHADHRLFDRVAAGLAQLVPEAGIVGDDEIQQLELRNVDARVEHLGKHAGSGGEPDARAMQRAADHVLVGARPGGGWRRLGSRGLHAAILDDVGRRRWGKRRAHDRMRSTP